MATKVKAQKPVATPPATTDTFTKPLTVPVPHGVVDWAACDHSANVATIRAAAEQAGYELASEPVFIDAEVNPDAIYTSSILNYRVEVQHV